MCRKGDIIFIRSYKDHGKVLSQHSFVVIEDEGGTIGGLDFDFISMVMSSIKSESQFKRKMRYDGNFPISSSDTNVPNGNKKDGYIKCDQLYYFKKSEIDYSIIGNVLDGVLEIIIDYLNELIDKQIPIDNIIDNL